MQPTFPFSLHTDANSQNPCKMSYFPFSMVVHNRFNYTHYDKKHGAIYKSIEALDKMGMDIIETGDPDAFKQYLLETDNTICGRHPISVFLHVIYLNFRLLFSYCFENLSCFIKIKPGKLMQSSSFHFVVFFFLLACIFAFSAVKHVL